MAPIILSGKEVAKGIEVDLTEEVRRLKAEEGATPGLATVLVGSDPASKLYLDMKEEACRRVGIISERHEFAEGATELEVTRWIEELNSDKKIHGIMVQLPLPGHLDREAVLNAIAPHKDVDGLTPENLGKVAWGDEGLAPATPKGIIALLESHKIEVEGRDAVIVNHSNILGKPLALMLLNRLATVEVCHVKTRDLGGHTRRADLLVAAVGKPNLIPADMVKKGAVVIDAGISRSLGKVVGDVDFEGVSKKASAITPVPGGVGPMTVAMLLQNTVNAARLACEGRREGL
jgi:methylenetetrahydrofolate dehydrogenase (NADP+)/methenyltetrahydrofolate cyclohydrolase